MYDRATKKTTKVPVQLRLLEYSKRTDSPAFSKVGGCLSFIGANMGKLDVALELAKEQQQRSRGKNTVRDNFLDRRIAWHRIRQLRFNSS